MEWLINWLWQGLVLAAIASVALSCLRGLNAATRHRVWWVTLWLVLLLPAASAGLSMAWANASTASTGGSTADPPAAIVLSGTPDWAFVAVGGVWFLWCLGSFTRTVRSLIALQRFRRQARPLPSVRQSRLPLWQSRRSQGRCASLCVSRDVATAGVFGFHPPIIALSPVALATLADADLDSVVAHEHAHVQRHDDVSRVLLVGIHSVFGLHPAVWWIGRAIDLEREIACDDWVLALTGDGPRYARCLTTLAGVAPAAPWSLAPGVSIAARRLTRRVTRLLDRTRRGGTRISPAAIGLWGPALLSIAMALAALKLVVVQEAEALAASATSAIEQEVATSMEAPPPTATPATPAAPPAASPVVRAASVQHRPDSALRPLVHHVRTMSVPAQISAFPESTPAAAAIAPPPALSNLRTAAAVAPLGTVASGVAGGTRPSVPVRATSDARKTSGPTPWSLAADAGVAIGTGSKVAAVKTAWFFSRFGKSVASSFQPTQVNLKH